MAPVCLVPWQHEGMGGLGEIRSLPALLSSSQFPHCSRGGAAV